MVSRRPDTGHRDESRPGRGVGRTPTAGVKERREGRTTLKMSPEQLCCVREQRNRAVGKGEVG